MSPIESDRPDWPVEGEALTRSLLGLDRVAASRQLEGLLADQPLTVVIDRLVSPVLEDLGRRWDLGEVALTQSYMASRILETVLGPYFEALETGPQEAARVAIGVLEDHHMLGRRAVLASLRAGGIAVADYGRVTVDEAVRRSLEDGIEVLLLSVLMLPSALRVSRVVEGLAAAGAPARVAVGGAPFRFDAALYREVGAHAMGRTAADALSLVPSLLKVRP